MKTLITGFEAFDKMDHNPSEAVAKELAQMGENRKALILPVTFDSCFEFLRIEIESYKPDRVICLGFSVPAEKILLEQVALNYIHARIPDNMGIQPQNKIITEGGENALFTTLPINEWCASIEKIHIPAELSYSAGTYVCNYLFYKLQEYAKDKKFISGFIHIPAFEIMPQAHVVKALNSVL